MWDWTEKYGWALLVVTGIFFLCQLVRFVVVTYF